MTSFPIVFVIVPTGGNLLASSETAPSVNRPLSEAGVAEGNRLNCVPAEKEEHNGWTGGFQLAMTTRMVGGLFPSKYYNQNTTSTTTRMQTDNVWPKQQPAALANEIHD
eukprot:CAMPEP_0168260990 /NCGR_PEP_ID=MMETSP0141_2-20121125/8761_1 /TAXON_ID=44445 /ORGANISM="Pseudo-nitzschia australis, Strain 10249 10 AB" /LENGTH=108 /DNA_ID=CAMNT_0008198951 /DNA_START=59 /DNA_END=383 /DNA_ORIENTATION=+